MRITWYASSLPKNLLISDTQLVTRLLEHIIKIGKRVSNNLCNDKTKDISVFPLPIGKDKPPELRCKHSLKIFFEIRLIYCILYDKVFLFVYFFELTNQEKSIE